jgi:hypothetical protein
MSIEGLLPVKEFVTAILAQINPSFHDHAKDFLAKE